MTCLIFLQGFDFPKRIDTNAKIRFKKRLRNGRYGITEHITWTDIYTDVKLQFVYGNTPICVQNQGNKEQT